MAESKRTMTIELDDALRITIVDGVPSLEVVDTYMQSQEQHDHWTAIANGGEVLDVLEQLREFVEKNTNLRGLRTPPA